MQIEIPILGDTVSFQIFGDSQARRCIFICPPGGLNFSDALVERLLTTYNYASTFPEYQVIIFDYPGIGTTKPYTKVNIPIIVDKIIAYLTTKNFTEVILVGFSFGGSIVNEILDKNPTIAHKAILAASGEFMRTPVRQFVIFLSHVTRISKKLNYVLYFTFVKVIRIFNEFYINDLDSLVQMGRSIFPYRLSSKVQSLPVALVFCKNDHLVRSDSVQKMKNKYPNHQLFEIPVRHTKKINTQEIAIIESLVKDKLIPFIKQS